MHTVDSGISDIAITDNSAYPTKRYPTKIFRSLAMSDMPEFTVIAVTYAHTLSLLADNIHAHLLPYYTVMYNHNLDAYSLALTPLSN